MLIRPPETLDFNSFGAIKRKIDSDYNANESLWQTYWKEATIDTRLEAGDTSLGSEIGSWTSNNSSNTQTWYFNRVRPICSMISGHQRRTRKSTIVVPLENADQHTADQWTKILMHIYNREGVDETISEAFHQGATIAGMNLLHVYVDWRNDPVSGEVKVDNCSYNSFVVDPYFRKKDLSDCNFVWRRSFMSHSAAASLFPEEQYDAIMALPGNPTGTGRDGRFQYMPESYGMTQANRLAYDEYYYRDYREQRLLVDKLTGETFELPDNADVDLDYFLSLNPNVEVIKQTIPTVRLALLLQDRVFYDGPNPLGIDRYPFVPVIGYYNPMMPYFYSRIQGVCRSLRDPQMLLNRRIILSADLLESQVNSGWIFKENAPVDVKHLFQTGQGRVIPIKDEAQLADIQPIIPPQIPPSFFQLQETFSKEMNLVSGVNEELLGSAQDDKAGILSALRQGAGLTTLQPLFDNLDQSQKLLGELVMDVVRANYTPGKIKNMLEGKEPAPLFYNKAFGKYHCQVEAGFNTDTQKQMQFAQLVQLREMGIQIPEDQLIESATIQNKTEIIQKMQAAQQAQAQQAQAVQQSQMQLQAAQAELAKSRSMADQGLGIERLSRVQENQALATERRAEARKDDEQALLNYVKALKEIEEIDLSQLQKILALKEVIAAQERENNQTRNEPPYPQGVSEDVVRGTNLAQ
jgi:hypothetical protein